MSHKHLTIENRIEIKTLLVAGKNNTEIAKQIGFSPSSISRELRRNTVNGYYAVIRANRFTLERRHSANQAHRVLTASKNKEEWNKLTRLIEKHIRLSHWSPEQISGRFRLPKEQGGLDIVVAVQTIYDWIYSFAKYLTKFLHHIRGRYRKSRTSRLNKRRREAWRDKIHSIDVRPEEVDKRKHYGHWEGDTVLGKNNGNTGRAGTFVERKSGYLLSFLLPPLSPEEQKLDEVNQENRRLTLNLRFADGATEQLMNKVKPKYQKTATLDNGSEMAGYEWIIRGTKGQDNPNGIRIYFAHAYHSWERGTNENTNGLLRFYFPKGTDFSKINEKDLAKAVDLLNNRPRKRLNYKTPAEVFKHCLIAI